MRPARRAIRGGPMRTLALTHPPQRVCAPPVLPKGAAGPPSGFFCPCPPLWFRGRRSKHYTQRIETLSLGAPLRLCLTIAHCNGENTHTLFIDRKLSHLLSHEHRAGELHLGVLIGIGQQDPCMIPALESEK